jgi:uncharacterized protein YlxW (UPF0749 family)
VSRPDDGARREPWRGAPSSPGLAMLAELMNNHLDPGYAEAKRRHELRPPPTAARARLRRGSTAATLLAIGVILAMAYQQAVDRAPDAAKAHAKLVTDVKNRSEQTDALQAQAERLREQLGREREDALASTTAGAKTAEDLRNLEASVGAGAVTGPGLTVTAGDGPPQKDPVTGEVITGGDPARLLDRDLQELVNALWEAGAEAVAIDGQRLTPTSTIRLAGEAILVDLRPVSSPYRIEVIGDPLSLDDRFAGSDIARRFRAYADRYGIVFSVASATSLKLPAATAPVLRYARSPGPSAPARTVPREIPTTGGPARGSSPTAVPSSPGGGR